MCDRPIRVKSREGDCAVSCGRCPPCLKRRTDSWVFRLTQEELRSSSAFFITLTYDTDHVPITDNGFMSLDKKAFPAFIKRVRKNLSLTGLKYYAVGEYGSTKMRPHYHAIVFNLPRNVFMDIGERRGHRQYISNELEKAWPFGIVDTGMSSGDSCAYVAKYVNKPGKRIPVHNRDDRVKEFSLVSKGLGDNYLHPSIVNYHRANPLRNYLTLEGGYKIAMPKYYRDRIYDDFDKAQQRAEIYRKHEDAYLEGKSDFFKKYGDDLSYDDYLDSKRVVRLLTFKKSLQTRDLQ